MSDLRITTVVVNTITMGAIVLQAVLSRMQIGEFRKSNALDKRAWLAINDSQFVSVTENSNTPELISVSVFNTGKTPAFKTQTAFSLIVGEDDFKTDWFDRDDVFDDVAHPVFMVFPGQKTPVEENRAVDFADFGDVMSGRRFLYVCVRVRYMTLDSPKSYHQTFACSRYDRFTRNLSGYRKYNHAT